MAQPSHWPTFPTLHDLGPEDTAGVDRERPDDPMQVRWPSLFTISPSHPAASICVETAPPLRSGHVAVMFDPSREMFVQPLSKL
jgi:hypothetical protein